MEIDLDQLTDFMAQTALQRHLGAVYVPLPSPDVIDKAVSDAYRRIWEVIWLPDEEDEE